MQGASDSNADRGTAADDLEEVEDDLLPQDLLLGDLDITSQDISLKGAPMQSKMAACKSSRRMVGHILLVLPLHSSSQARQHGHCRPSESRLEMCSSATELVQTQAESAIAGVDDELDRYAGHEVLRAILDQGCDPKEYGRHYGARLRQAELESIQDYLSESDNLVTLHQQVHTNAHSCMLSTHSAFKYPPGCYAMLRQHQD